MATEPGAAPAPVPARELFDSRWGFVMAAVGSAVGLGNMWRFAYVAAEGGGAAFLVLYTIMVLFLGIPLMLSELVVGRNTHLSPVGALRKLGGRRWSALGMLFVLAGFLILSYYSVIAGWTMRFAAEAAVSGFAADPGAHFSAIAEGTAASLWHLVFMVGTIGIVMAGVKGGIERAALILMPTLVLIIIALALWAATLDGASEGYAYYLSPDLSRLLDPTVIGLAASQAFFSLSLGMGAMLTFASYLSRDEDLNEQAVIISFADFGVAFVSGLVVFPVIFALGLQGSVGESTVGTLFIALPGAFASMGAAGRIVGLLFFVALGVGAITSAISLLEVVTASVIDEFGITRRKAAIGTGALIALFGLLPAWSTDFLGLVDQIAGALLLAIGGFFMVVFVGWRMKDPAAEMLRGAGPRFAAAVPGVMFLVKWVLPLAIAAVVYVQLGATWTVVQDFLAAG